MNKMGATVIKPVNRGVVDASNYRDDILNRMEWVSSRSAGSRSTSDVSIVINSKGKNAAGENISFTFRNGVAQMISDTEYAQICIHKNRIYFRESDSVNGYKLTTNHKNIQKSGTRASQENRYFKISKISEVAKAFIGDYDMKYDDFLELYYIEKEV